MGELRPHIPEIRHAPVLPYRSTYSPWLTDGAFRSAFSRIEAHTLVDRLRCHELWSLVGQSAKLNRGALLEVGVWRGGTGCLIAHAAKHFGMCDPVYLCDTFTGVVKAGDMDTRYQGGEHADTSAESVRALARDLQLATIQIVQGVFPDESAQRIPEDFEFRFVHLDLDVYQSTKDALDYLWPRLVAGGIVVFDDYGTHGCEGVTRLVNDLAMLPDRVFIHNVNGHGVLIKTLHDANQTDSRPPLIHRAN